MGLPPGRGAAVDAGISDEDAGQGAQHRPAAGATQGRGVQGRLVGPIEAVGGAVWQQYPRGRRGRRLDRLRRGQPPKSITEEPSAVRAPRVHDGRRPAVRRRARRHHPRCAARGADPDLERDRRGPLRRRLVDPPAARPPPDEHGCWPDADRHGATAPGPLSPCVARHICRRRCDCPTLTPCPPPSVQVRVVRSREIPVFAISVGTGCRNEQRVHSTSAQLEGMGTP